MSGVQGEEMMRDHGFRARYDDICLKCHGEIMPGDWVAYDADGNLMHVKCLDEDDEE